MKKYLNYIVAFLIVAILFISPIKISADSGFDAGYDSGGGFSSSSSSDWGSSSSSSSYGGLGDSMFLFVLLITGVAYAVYSVIGGAICLKFKKNDIPIIYSLPYWTIYTLLMFRLFYIEGIVDVILIYVCYIVFKIEYDKHKVSIPRKVTKEYNIDSYAKIEDEKLKQDLFKIYKDVQIAWMNMDLEPVRGVLTDEVYNMYKTQLLTLKHRSQKNIMEEIEFVDARLVRKIELAGKETLEIILKVTCKDYIVSTKTKYVVRGNPNFLNEYVYQLTFVRNVGNAITKCPNCGGELNDSNSECKYCRSVIVHESSNYALAKKKMLHQRRKW